MLTKYGFIFCRERTYLLKSCLKNKSFARHLLWISQTTFTFTLQTTPCQQNHTINIQSDLQILNGVYNTKILTPELGGGQWDTLPKLFVFRF